MNYFTSDIHFSDTKTLVGEYRPFKSVDEYDKFVVKEWNKTAKKGDTIYVIGDLLDCNDDNSCEWQKGLLYTKKVKADVVLVVGNNEERIIKYYFNNSFEKFCEYCKLFGIKSVHKNLEIEMGGKKFNLVHEIVNGNKKMVNLFGHTHLTSGFYNPYGLCVSTDLNHFRLFTEQMIFELLDRKQKFWESDDNLNYQNPFIKEVGGKLVNIKQKNNKYWEEYQKFYPHCDKTTK